MYNGIGLATPRGSGTSGYIQRNLSFVKQRRTDFPASSLGTKDSLARAPKIRKQDPELVEHERRRQIEIQLIEFSDKLEKTGMELEDIEKMVAAERLRLLEKKVLPETSGVKTPHNRPASSEASKR